MFDGDGQTGRVATPVNFAPAVRVLDAADSPLPELRRVDLRGYLGALVGSMFVVDYGSRLLETGPSLEALGGFTLGLFGVGGAIYTSLNPRNDRQREPAPTYLYVFAAISTAAFLVVLWLRLSKV